LRPRNPSWRSRASPVLMPDSPLRLPTSPASPSSSSRTGRCSPSGTTGSWSTRCWAARSRGRSATSSSGAGPVPGSPSSRCSALARTAGSGRPPMRRPGRGPSRACPTWSRCACIQRCPRGSGRWTLPTAPGVTGAWTPCWCRTWGSRLRMSCAAARRTPASTSTTPCSATRTSATSCARARTCPRPRQSHGSCTVASRARRAS